MNILIIKLSAIGDVVMALPMIEAVNRIYPEARITWLCGKTVAPLLQQITAINDCIVIDEARLLSGSIPERMKVLLDVWRSLLGRRYDLIVTGHIDPRYRLIGLFARGTARRSFGRLSDRLFPVPGRHHSDEYVRLVTNIDGPDAVQGVLPVLSLAVPEQIGSLLMIGISPIVALAPGGAKNLLNDNPQRRWPLENYVRLAQRLLDNGIQVVVSGSSDDSWVCEHFHNVKVTNLIGMTNLVDLVGLYGHCDVVVTHDSGPLHLAGLAGKPIVALFGPTNPDEKVPRTSGTKILWGGETLPCRPCYDGKKYTPCSNNVCLKSVSVDAVFKEIVRILAGNK